MPFTNFVLTSFSMKLFMEKGSLYNKMPYGDDWQKRAQCRLVFAMMAAQSGKKMIFMVMEWVR